MTETIRVPLEEALRILAQHLPRTDGHPRQRPAQPGRTVSAGSLAEGVADHVRERILRSVPAQVADRERHNTEIRSQLGTVLRRHLFEQLRDHFGALYEQRQDREAILAKVCQAVAHHVQVEMSAWIGQHIAQAIRDDVTEVLHDRLDEALRGAFAQGHLGGTPEGAEALVTAVRERLAESLGSRIVAGAGKRVTAAAEPHLRDALVQQLKDAFHHRDIQSLLDEAAWQSPGVFALAVGGLVAEQVRDKLGTVLAGVVRQYLTQALSERAELFRERISEAIERGAAGPDGGQPAITSAADADALVRMAQEGVDEIVNERLGQVLRERIDEVLQQRISDAVRVALSSAQLGFALSLDDADVTRISDEIHARIARSFRRRVTKVVRARVAEAVRNRVADALYGTLDPVAAEVAAWIGPGSGSTALQPSRYASVF